jgi:hypothetical protein
MVECGSNWVMGQSRAGWPMDGRWSTGKGWTNVATPRLSRSVGVQATTKRAIITHDGRYCARAKSDMSLDGARGRSEVDLSDMCGFCTAVDGVNGVFRCGESCGGLREGCRRKRRKKGEGKVEEEEWMDGSITGFTELTASSQPASTAQAILPAAAWTWVL